MPHRPNVHQPAAPKTRHQPRRHRPSASQRGYGRRWRRLRDLMLRKHPWCADPFGHHREDGKPYVVAEHVDHIVPLSAGGTNAESNLQCLCAMCHRRKTVLHDGGFGRTKRSYD